jgi:transcriptional accessory protein Tex/SPT6
LDATGIHPEMYDKTYTLLESECGIKPSKKEPLILPLAHSVFAGWDERKIVSLAEKYEIGFETLSDIISELQRP